MIAKCVQTLGLVFALSIAGFAQQPPASASPPKADSAAFAVNDANEILAQFREALAAHSQKNFSPSSMPKRCRGITLFKIR